VADAKDLKPRKVSDLRCTGLPDQVHGARTPSGGFVGKRT